RSRGVWMSRVHDGGGPAGPQRSRPPPRGPARPEPPRARPAPGARRTPARERSVEHGGGPPSGPSRVRLGGTVHGRGGWSDARVLPRIPPPAGDRPLPPRIRERYRKPPSARVLLLLPCSARKPYSTSRS